MLLETISPLGTDDINPTPPLAADFKACISQRMRGRPGPRQPSAAALAVSPAWGQAVSADRLPECRRWARLGGRRSTWTRRCSGPVTPMETLFDVESAVVFHWQALRGTMSQHAGSAPDPCSLGAVSVHVIR